MMNLEEIMPRVVWIVFSLGLINYNQIHSTRVLAVGFEQTALNKQVEPCFQSYAEEKEPSFISK
jgi:hypothetical protein